jgi:hypothetical protein
VDEIKRLIEDIKDMKLKSKIEQKLKRISILIRMDSKSYNKK